MTFDGTCERGGVQRAPQEAEMTPPAVTTGDMGQGTGAAAANGERRRRRSGPKKAISTRRPNWQHLIQSQLVSPAELRVFSKLGRKAPGPIFFYKRGRGGARSAPGASPGDRPHPPPGPPRRLAAQGGKGGLCTAHRPHQAQAQAQHPTPQASKCRPVRCMCHG
jgi:hypothetical protein